MELIILSSLFLNKQYLKRVIPYLSSDFFDSPEDKTIFNAIKGFVYRYKKKPTFSAIATIIEKKKNINESVYTNIIDRLEEINGFKEENDLKWLIDSTEEYCQQKGFENAIIESAEILENGENKYKAKELIDEALKINFNREIGIEFFNKKDILKRYEYYNTPGVKFRTNIEKFNDLTYGGPEEKALHVFMGDTHVGKTMTLSSLTAGFIANGYDTAYITLEMSQEKIANLIDANLLDIQINNVKDIDPDDFVNKYENFSNNYGRLFIKEFPTTTAGVSAFRALLDDWKYKKDFIPKVIVVDYINIMKCDRYKDQNSFVLIKAISEELRGLAVEGNYCILSATQINREGAKSSDIDMTDTAESYGLPQTVDLLIGLMSSETLREQNIMIWKSLKNRLSGIIGAKFPVKTNFAYARLLDCDVEHEDIVHNDIKNKVLMEKEEIKNKLRKVNTNSSNKTQEKDLFG